MKDEKTQVPITWHLKSASAAPGVLPDHRIDQLAADIVAMTRLADEVFRLVFAVRLQ
jgi:hypothetical protein